VSRSRNRTQPNVAPAGIKDVIVGVRYLTDELRPGTAQGPSTAAEFADAVGPNLAAMTRLAARLGPNGGHDDVVQEALVRAWRHRGQFDARRGTFSAWLMTIVANEARRAVGRVRLPVRVEPVGRTATPDDRLDIEQALTRLSARQRLAVDCFYFAGLTLAETAAVMRCSDGTVKSTLSDARERLRLELGDRTP
jgi:RNA polymerase sigma factor (sigma-70 family)